MTCRPVAAPARMVLAIIDGQVHVMSSLIAVGILAGFMPYDSGPGWVIGVSRGCSPHPGTSRIRE